MWKTWTEPERVKRWWGPNTFTAPSAKIDLRVRGMYLYCLRSPESKDYWSTGVSDGEMVREKEQDSDDRGHSRA